MHWSWRASAFFVSDKTSFVCVTFRGVVVAPCTSARRHRISCACNFKLHHAFQLARLSPCAGMKIGINFMYDAQFASVPKRGRPAIALSDRLRVSVWSHLVLLASGLTEIQELEALSVSVSGLRLSSGLWSRYMRGKVIPQGALDDQRNTTLVHRMDNFLPGTADIFFSPIWSLIAWNPKVDLEEMKRGYCWLRKDIFEHFVDEAYLDCGKGAPGYGYFWYRYSPFEDRLRLVNRFDVWDALAACLLEARMCYAAQDQFHFAAWQIFAGKTIVVLQERPEFKEKHLHSVFLTMEWMCLLTLLTNLHKTNWVRDELNDRRIDWERSWNSRCKKHLRNLSRKSQIAFIAMINEVRRMDGVPRALRTGSLSPWIDLED